MPCPACACAAPATTPPCTAPLHAMRSPTPPLRGFGGGGPNSMPPRGRGRTKSSLGSSGVNTAPTLPPKPSPPPGGPRCTGACSLPPPRRPVIEANAGGAVGRGRIASAAAAGCSSVVAAAARAT
eukprot:350730-Chlamydomonas_euryale.AAC.4